MFKEGGNMTEYQEEITELNMSYLLLAQQMLKDDTDAAMICLGIGKEMAELISGLTAAQILSISTLGMILGRARIDEQILLKLVCNHNKPHLMPQMHTSILMLGQTADELV
jgi:flagellar transcriptional activator FlhD